MLKWLGGLRDSNEKELKRLGQIVERINGLEPEFSKLSDGELRAKTDEFKTRLAKVTAKIRQQLTEARKKQAETWQLEKELREVKIRVLDELLPEAFAAVREAAKRTLGQRHFDVQLIGGIILHQGKIAEMKTGEGKTLTATLTLYLNSLTGEGAHLVTVNDYLARRDSYWMGPIYHALGASAASIYPQQTPDEHIPARLYDPEYDSGDNRWRHFRPISRGEAYQADITYGTSNEFGFDYLRDNMAIDLKRCVQRQPNYAIVDEVDNLLIDEARTPLIISAPDVEAGKLYQLFARLVLRLKGGSDYEIKEKERNAQLTDDGYANMEKLLKREGVLKSASLYDPGNMHLIRHLRNALTAGAIYKKDRDYVVKNGEIIIVDEFTGRLMLGRRYSEGLHQAIEAKEHVKVQQESRTFASITIQNYFRMYEKLAGMTGTALTEAEEFHTIYKLDVVIIPSHKEMIRKDFSDQIYKDEKSKFRAVAREIGELHKEGRPVLVGTVSIEKSEHLSDLLKRNGIPHQILNAKQHEKEADIIARAGELGAVTVATNMAGRGVDIVLGGKEPTNGDKLEWRKWQENHNQVVELGGLHVTGTERHEARRIDNQLRGRAGRQGDPGSSRFYVSVEDDIMRRFGSDKIKGLMEWAGMDENTPIENRLVTRSIGEAQKRVEGYHFDIRKHLVEYDDVINRQREIIYDERRKMLSGADLKSNILSMVREELQGVVAAHLADAHEPDLDGLIAEVATILPPPAEINAQALSQMKSEQIEERLTKHTAALYDEREKELGADNMRVLEQLIMLRTIDNLWIEHLTAIDYVRQGIGLQAMAQRDPLVAYKRESHHMFEDLMSAIQHDVVHTIYHSGITRKEAPQSVASPMAELAAVGTGSDRRQPARSTGKKMGRNDPCHCGSGKKFKKCCGK